MNMKHIKYILVLFLFVGCTGDFEELNTNPNDPVSVPTAYLMTSAQRSAIYSFNTTGMLYAQHWAETQYTSTSTYETEEASFNGYYTGALADLQTIINLNTNEATKGAAAASGSNDNQIAVARIIKVWLFQEITDIWGEIPYSEALAGVENITPAYDTQESIYTSLVNELEEAAAQIDVNAAGMEGDIIYGGDMAKWRKFANSLRVRVGMRMSEVAPAVAESVVSSALGADVFADNSDNALYAYLSDAANDNPYYQHFLTRTDYAVSDVLVDFMKQRNDPRLPVYANTTGDNTTDEIVGMPYGVSEAIAGSVTNASISFPGDFVRSATSAGVIMTHSELLFLQAEAIARGWVAGDAAATYNEAILSSMEYFGVDAADAAAYLTEADVVYDAANYRQLIGEQKWLALYTNGMESWSEWRRLDYPTLVPAPNAQEGREIPRRRAYTSREYNLNEANINAAVDRQGADVMSTRVWWDN
ncbi:SusD/RagB family nutrient-binding outer membrane lipoprotein [Roseivirga pacifica]|nr:SusD/RagB family nutrient-binding outer membrane lipoprotein [Roseivirga pacifica]MCO6366977.1 SusD/RagB family nutrient-binding outer membrane lipoprotein [Roseivirga pacifica]MCO6370491.1 SusD/RagB family nutrient-binding outer membrane lipoprotein [Roseivirga pacifica]MCO6374634.1 SusD/RagB family nutrient-binding outer membrane lipoprotein [Roseivirga pacifica]MCO6379892.1 SusD/RagB family nutrient-binding outer membrane lipoprotein [Roseivirga pacifica]